MTTDNPLAESTVERVAPPAVLVVFGASGDLVVHERPADPDCPVNDLPSIRFDFTLSRETEADRLGGRVGADPASMMSQAAE